MIYRLKYTIPFFLLITSAVFAQSSDEELLDWSATRKLTWADYKSSPEPDSDAAASTTTYLGISYDINNRSFSYKIESRFSKTHSWGLHKTAYILSHEQGHFDIAEIFARKLNKKMSEYKFDRRTYQKDLNKIYDDVTKEKTAFQNKYDRETNHSINKAEQAKWLKLIAIMLEDSEAYADY